jgi:hypothetical protein
MKRLSVSLDITSDSHTLARLREVAGEQGDEDSFDRDDPHPRGEISVYPVA